MPYPTWKKNDRQDNPALELINLHSTSHPIPELIPKKGSSRCTSVDLAFSRVNTRAQNTFQNKDCQSACEQLHGQRTQVRISKALESSFPRHLSSEYFVSKPHDGYSIPVRRSGFLRAAENINIRSFALHDLRSTHTSICIQVCIALPGFLTTEAGRSILARHQRVAGIRPSAHDHSPDSSQRRRRSIQQAREARRSI